MKNKNGFMVPLLVVIVAIIFLGGGYYLYSNKNLEITNEVASQIPESVTEQGSETSTIKKDNGIYNKETLLMLKDLEPADDFCKVITGEIEYINSEAYKNETLRQKYSRGYDEKSVSVSCLINIADNPIYLLFEKPNEDKTSLKTYDMFGKFLQEIPLEYYYTLNTTVSFKDDINFDDYPDMLALDWMGASTVISSYWEFNPNTGIFEKRKDLTELALPKFDKLDKKITGYEHGNAETGMYYELSYINSVWVITKTDSVEYVEPLKDLGKDGSRKIIRVIKELKDGIMATTSVENLKSDLY